MSQSLDRLKGRGGSRIGSGCPGSPAVCGLGDGFQGGSSGEPPRATVQGSRVASEQKGIERRKRFSDDSGDYTEVRKATVRRCDRSPGVRNVSCPEMRSTSLTSRSGTCYRAPQSLGSNGRGGPAYEAESGHVTEKRALCLARDLMAHSCVMASSFDVEQLRVWCSPPAKSTACKSAESCSCTNES